VQARVEALRGQGRDPFNEYQVPQAVMMFRQGFGRLIRTRSDRGIVAVLDPRVVSKRYGEVFLRSLPDCAVTTEIKAIAEFIKPLQATNDEAALAPAKAPNTTPEGSTDAAASDA
jgi:ATP-dependent DNA helicase DinG